MISVLLEVFKDWGKKLTRNISVFIVTFINL